MKTIDCPAHPNGKLHWWSLHRHKAVLFEHGEHFAGTWDCLVTGESDDHQHDNYQVEVVESWPSSPTDIPYESEVYVCGTCHVTIEDEYPEVDRAEAIADRQIMEALGK